MAILYIGFTLKEPDWIQTTVRVFSKIGDLKREDPPGGVLRLYSVPITWGDGFSNTGFSLLAPICKHRTILIGHYVTSDLAVRDDIP